MRRSDNHECTLCGAIVDVLADAKLKVMTARDAPTMRVLKLGGKEIHRCRKTTPSGDQHLWSADERGGRSVASRPQRSAHAATSGGPGEQVADARIVEVVTYPLRLQVEDDTLPAPLSETRDHDQYARRPLIERIDPGTIQLDELTIDRPTNRCGPDDQA